MKKSPILALLGLALLACAPSESTSGSTVAESPSEHKKREGRRGWAPLFSKFGESFFTQAVP